MNPMNPEWKAKWLKALRSGEYKQGTGLLNGPTGFCCLGVLCDLVAKEDTSIVVEQMDIGAYSYTRYDWQGHGLPLSVCKVTGVQAMGQFGPQYDKNKKYPSPYLSNLNDMGWDFNRIADVIEKEL